MSFTWDSPDGAARGPGTAGDARPRGRYHGAVTLLAGVWPRCCAAAGRAPCTGCAALDALHHAVGLPAALRRAGHAHETRAAGWRPGRVVANHSARGSTSSRSTRASGSISSPSPRWRAGPASAAGADGGHRLHHPRSAQARAQQALFEERLRAGTSCCSFPKAPRPTGCGFLPSNQRFSRRSSPERPAHAMHIQPVSVVYRAAGQRRAVLWLVGRHGLRAALLRVLAAPRGARSR